MIEIKLPVSEEEIRKLKVGDEVKISGTIMTARDMAHKHMVEAAVDEELANVLNGSMIYHCGPVVKKERGEWRFVAAGPTTSMREEPYQAAVIEKYGVRGVIGKGGMGEKTLAGLKESGAVYLHAIGGLAVLLAESVVKVRKVFKLEEFGTPEAMWVIEVKDFPAVVTMDSSGKSLHNEIRKMSEESREEILKSL
ncbi:MAG: hypothetical protein Kow0090_08250 [Myxococcota bacterium]